MILAQILLTQQMQLCFRPDLSKEFRLSFSGNLTCGTQLIVTQAAALRAQVMASSLFSVLEAQMVGKLLSTLQQADGHSNLGGMLGYELGGLLLLHPSA